MSVLGSRIFYINSENRIEGTSSNFTYRLETGANFDTCCVLAMNIPKSYYLVRDGYNTFKLDGQPITVPAGNYSYVNFASTVIPLIAAHGVVLTMKLDAITGKYGFTVDRPVTVEFSSQLAQQFGFDEHSVNHWSGTFSSKNVLNFNSTTTLFLHSDMVDDASSILQEVYSDNVVPLANISYRCAYPMSSKKLSKQGSTVFNFSLTDEHMQEVFLNGHDICVTLLMYKKENLTKLFRQIFPPGNI